MSKLHFFYAAMSAGKSAHLLQAAFNYEQRGMRVLLLAPNIDTREGGAKITSRLGIERDAISISKTRNLYDLFCNDASVHDSRADAIFVDEAQFLTEQQVLQLTKIVDKFSRPVLAYGLRTDFQGEPFEGSKYLLAWADELVEVKTICKSGRKATMSGRFDESGNRVYKGEQIQVGYNYEPMSRHIFELEKVRS